MNQNFSHAFHWPLQSDEIRDSLLEVYESGKWGKYDGGCCQMLTNALANLTELSLVRLCSSGTIAVEIALAAVGVKQGDEVVLAGYDFPGNFRAIENIGATPVLCDIDPVNWSLDPRSMSKALSDKTRAIVVSHLHGGVADIESIVELAREREIRVIEDICQCPGAKLKDKPLGKYGDICAMSFGGSKLLSAGRGGAIATDDEAIFQRAKIFCERGNDAFPLSELQAAVMLPQIYMLEEFSSRRRTNVKRFKQKIATIDSAYTLEGTKDSLPDYYKVPIRLESTANKQTLINSLRSKGIVIDHGFSGFTNRSKRRCRQPVDLTHSANASEATLVLHHPCLLSYDFEAIVDEVLTSISSADRN